MKKRSLILILSLLLALGTAACGTQSAAENGTGQSTPDAPSADNSGLNAPNGTGGSGLNTTGTSVTDNSGTYIPDGIGTDILTGAGSDGFSPDLAVLISVDTDSLAFSSLTDFYNSDLRTEVEDTVNELSELCGLHTFITVEEPDTLIYNYQYTISLASIGISHEEMAAVIAAEQQETDIYNDVMNDMEIYRLCGLPVEIIRMNYLDTDGSLVYSVDFTEEGSTSVLPGSTGIPGDSGTASDAYADLQDWMASSEDVALTVESTNRSLASSGITFDLSVDGSVLVYKYYLPKNYFSDSLAEEDLTNTFDSMVNAGSASVDAVVSMFMEKYGLKVDAVRFAYYSANGTELYSRDVTAAP
ncbi:MAG: DUF4854 domain-containing protein [Butyrivibrio sp.]|nr:DUF4854 domain-containing protein [Acetatifactor muris]MCM1561749.1 DUF4854 domain-containing protein [Butyrivibrio sp.]